MSHTFDRHPRRIVLSSCGIDDVIGGSSPALTKRSDTSSRLYSVVVNFGGLTAWLTAKVVGEPIVMEGGPVVVAGGGPLPVPFAEERALCIVRSQCRKYPAWNESPWSC